MTTPLPKPLPNQTYITFSALCGGHLTLPDSAFVHPADPSSNRYVPSLSFLLTHPGLPPTSSHPSLFPLGKPIHILFDLGLRSSATRYLPRQQTHLETRAPYSLRPSVPETLRTNGIDPQNDIDVVILSHVHYDHHGDPEAFPHARFLVGHRALALLKHGLPADSLGAHQIFTPDLLPSDRTSELPLQGTTWKPLGPFPATLDLLGDSSIYIVDTPGHLPGHINLLFRSTPSKWICLAGDAFHDPRLLSGEREIGTWKNGEGRTCCIHLDRAGAEASIARLREVRACGNVEIIAAHDEAWERENGDRFLGGAE